MATEEIIGNEDTLNSTTKREETAMTNQTNKSRFRTFQQARKYARSLGFKSSTEWRKWRSSGQRPADIPTTPDDFYKDEWKGWHDFLGTGREFLSYDEAREEARKLAKKYNLKGSADWNRMSRDGDRPDNIPSNPLKHYRDKGWVDWYDFLGREDLRPLSFEEAREVVRKLNLASAIKWRALCQNQLKPKNIPGNPDVFYKDNGWTNWSDFLGTPRAADKAA